MYGCIMLMAATAYFILESTLKKLHGPDSDFANTFGTSLKDTVSCLLYVIAIGGSFISSWIGIVCYILVAIIWFIPERRVGKKIA
jgi:uncharacterized membrane protein